MLSSRASGRDSVFTCKLLALSRLLLTQAWAFVTQSACRTCALTHWRHSPGPRQTRSVRLRALSERAPQLGSRGSSGRPAGSVGELNDHRIRCHKTLAQTDCVAAFNTADFQYQNISAMGEPTATQIGEGGLRRPGRGLDFKNPKNPKNPKYRKPRGLLTCHAACRHQICAVPKRR